MVNTPSRIDESDAVAVANLKRSLDRLVELPSAEPSDHVVSAPLLFSPVVPRRDWKEGGGPALKTSKEGVADPRRDAWLRSGGLPMCGGSRHRRAAPRAPLQDVQGGSGRSEEGCLCPIRRRGRIPLTRQGFWMGDYGGGRDNVVYWYLIQ